MTKRRGTDVLTVPGAAALCSVSRRTMLRWLKAGHLPGHSTPGGHHRILWRDLERFMRRRGMVVPGDAGADEVRVAIVDDDRAHVSAMESLLSLELPQAMVRSAFDGFAAGHLVGSFEPHVLLLDILMPGLDGFEVCRLVSREPALRHSAVIVVSAFLDDEAEERMRALGARECIRKPVDPEALLEAVRKHLPVQAEAVRRAG